jgi:predicted PurR-regulated permease PerM
MENKEVQKYVLIGLFLILLYVSYLLIKPFLAALISSFILAYILHPIYKRIKKIVKKDYIASAITTLLAIFIVILPIALVGNVIFKEATSMYENGALQKAGIIIQNYIKNPDIMSYITANSVKVIEFISSSIGKMIMNLPSMIISILITIITTFYLLMNGEDFIKQVKKAIPFKHKDEFIENVGETTYSIVNGFFMVAVIEFIISAIAFSVLGIEGAFIWAAIVAFTSLLPLIGPFLVVFMPLAILNLINQNYITLVLLGVAYALVAYVENITRSKIIGNRAKMHPVVILIGIIGGIELFGLIGMIAGPLILSMMIVIIENYYYEYIKD